MISRDWLRGAQGVVLLSVMAVVLVMVWPAYLPTTDGPQQIYGAYILNNYATLKSWYEPGIPVGAAGFPLIFFPATRVLPWEQAYRLSLGILAILWCGGAVVLARTLHPSRVWLAAGGATLVFQWSLYMGFFSFLMGTSLGILVLAEMLSERRRPWVIAIGLTTAAILHLFSGVLAILVVVAAGLSEEMAWEERLKVSLRRLLLPFGWLGVMFLLSRSGKFSIESEMTLPLEDQLLALAKMGVGGPFWRSAFPLVVALIAALSAVVRGVRKEGKKRDFMLALAVLALFFAALVSPLHLTDWRYFFPRFLPLATLLGMLLLPVEALSNKVQRGLQVVLGGWVVASLVWIGMFHRRLEASAAPYLEVARAPVHQEGPRLPILSHDPWFRGLTSMSTDFPYMDPIFVLSMVTPYYQGGIFPYSFTTNKWIHPFVTKLEHPPFPPVPPQAYYWLGLVDPQVREQQGLRGAILVDTAQQGAPYQDVVLFGPPADQDVFLRLGYQAKWRSEHGLIGAFHGCPAQLTIRRPPDAPRMLQVALGWFPLLQPASIQHVEASDEVTIISLKQVPCGPIWIDVMVEGAPWHCEGAEKDGRLLMLQRSKEADLSCHWVNSTPEIP